MTPPLPQTAVPTTLMRGGTSRGPFFLESDLPPVGELRDRVLLAVMGSPHPLQVDGVGGGNPLTSKAGVVALSPEPDIDLDFTFGQLRPESDTVQFTANCGNLLAAVLPFAIERGLITPVGDRTTATIRTTNTGLLASVTVVTPLVEGTDRRFVAYDGDTRIAGVGATSSPVEISFLDTAGSVVGQLLPTGNLTDDLVLPDTRTVSATLIDNGQPLVVLRADELGIAGVEPPHELENEHALKRGLEALRLQAGELMGLGDVSSVSYPKMTLVSPPSGDGVGALSTRSFIPHTVHRSIGVLAAVTVATAACMPGTVAATVAEAGEGRERTLTVEHPSGGFPVHLTFDEHGDVVSSGITRTARNIMVGAVNVSPSVWSPGRTNQKGPAK
ncbi:MAG TPA: hypothetical protein H9870_13610 [Candidatus Corynebacterium avicola]|uniref:4-oxalomesaconate tautomerase n=1 Tax=Candidatus Corynebacterium avicola TaxID=2838527 RepID=A0A9D1ULU1_9CORY|nr:hypothetical protein [Candidatus Corynebacterium avicola]